MKLLLSHHRVNPAASDNCAIRLACKNGHTETTKLLLANDRMDPTNAKEYETIRCASFKGYTEIVKVQAMSNPRVDPAAKENQAIRLAS